MKRMYVTLLIIFGITAWGLTSVAQIVLPSSDVQKEDAMKREKRLQMHHDLHQKLRQSLFNGTNDIDQIFKDFEEAFNQDFSDSFQRFNSLSSQLEAPYKTEWEESKEGRTLKVIPKDKDQNISIDVQDEMISISGKSNQSSFTNRFSFPQDCDASKVKMTSEGNHIVLFLPYKVKIKEGRIPLPSQDSDVQI